MRLSPHAELSHQSAVRLRVLHGILLVVALGRPCEQHSTASVGLTMTFNQKDTLSKWMRYYLTRWQFWFLMRCAWYRSMTLHRLERQIANITGKDQRELRYELRQEKAEIEEAYREHRTESLTREAARLYIPKLPDPSDED
jgi:hypothetical protein